MPRDTTAARVAWLCAGTILLISGHANAQLRAPETAPRSAQGTTPQWQTELQLDQGVVVSDNVFLARRGAERADVTFRTSPTIGLRRNSGRLRFDGRYSPVILGFLNETREEALFNLLDANGSYEVLDGRVFVDGKALISQAFLSPFGSQPAEFATGTLNRTEVRTMSVSPFIRGRLGDGGRYRLRSDNSYTTFTAQSSAFSITTTGVSGEVAGAQGSLVSLAANGLYSLSSYGSGAELTNQSATARATLNVDPEFVPYVTGGYESNEYFLATFRGPRYGGGFKWQPSPLTSVDISIERRYFGTAFDVDVSYRTRLSLWTLKAYRTDRVTPVGGVGFGFGAVSTREFLSSLLRSQYPDEAERRIAVDRLVSTGLLPSTLSQPAAFASPRVLLVEGVEPSVAFNGVRNSVVATVFWLRNTPISGNGALNITDVFNTVNGFEQIGGSLTWIHQFTAHTSTSAGADQISTESVLANTTRPESLKMDQTVYRLFLTHEITADTNLIAGIRFTRFVTESSASPNLDARERMLQLGVVHKFF